MSALASGHQPPGSPYGLYCVDRGDRRRSQELQDGDRPLLLGLLPESISGACHSHLHGFWLVQADREQYSRTIGPVVPSIEAGKAQRERRYYEDHTNEKIDGEVKRVGENADHTRLMIREKRQDKCRHARDDGEPFRHRMRSTEPEYEGRVTKLAATG